MKAIKVFFMVLVGLAMIQNLRSQIKWYQKADKPSKNMCYGLHFKNKIYVSYLNSQDKISIEEFDPATNTWVTKKGISNNKNAGVYCFVATSKKIYILGGFYNSSASNKVEEYDPALDTFITKKNLPVSIDCATASAVNDKIYVIGGVLSNSNEMIKKTFEYDPESETWFQKADSPRKRRESYAITIENKIYCSGGLPLNSGSNIVDVYDPANDSWTAGTQNISNKWGIGLGYAKNSIYLVTGTFLPQTVNLTGAEIYQLNLETNSVNKIEDKVNAIWQMATVSVNDSIYLIGGLKGEFPVGPKQSITEMFTPTSSLLNTYVKTLRNFNITYNAREKRIIISPGLKRNRIMNIALCSIDGRILMQSEKTISDEIEISTAKLKRGVYLVNVYTTDRFESSKVYIY